MATIMYMAENMDPKTADKLFYVFFLKKPLKKL